MREITSTSNVFIKELIKFYDRKMREAEKKFLIEGYHLVKEASEANLLEQVLVVDCKDAIYDVPTIIVTYEIIQKLSKTTNPQPIIGVCKMPNTNKIIGNHILILDDVNDPGNLGTLIRSALGFNVSTIILSPNTVDCYNDKVIRATQGAIFKVNIIVMDLVDAINEIKKMKISVIGTTLENSVGLDSLKNLNGYALLLGNEARGVSKNLLDLCDLNVRINMNSKLESLNVAVAGSIIMHYLDL